MAMQQGIMSRLDQMRQGMAPMGQGQQQVQQPQPQQPPVPREMLSGMGIESGPIGGPTNPESYPGQGQELMQDMAPEMVEPQVDPAEDAENLASAVLQRSKGNPDVALSIIEGAKGMVMQMIGASGMMNGGEIPKYDMGGALKPVPEGNAGAGLRKLPDTVRENMGFMNMGGSTSELQTALNRLNMLRGD